MNEQQLSITNIIDMMLRRWVIILVTTIIGGTAFFVVSEFFMTPVYSSSASLYVDSGMGKTGNSVSQSDLMSSRQLVMTYAEILQSRTFLSTVAEELDGEYTAAQIRRMITMGSLNDTEILSVTVKGTDTEDVYRITRSIVRNAPDEFVRVIEAGSVKVLDDASKPITPISPNIRKNTFVGIFLGLILGAFIVIVLELFDTRIKSGEEITQRYQEPLLGEIPSLMSHGKKHSNGHASKNAGGGK